MYSVLIAYILWLGSFFGALGFHRFYLGKTLTGFLWMFSGGLFGIGSIYDLLTLPAQVREANMLKALHEQIRRQHTGKVGWRYANDAQFRVMDGKAPEKEHPEQVILKIAKENNGILTVSDVALGANVPMEESKKLLEALVTKGFVELRVRKSGSLVYVVPDMLDKDQPLENF
ncbi:MAG: TM2 domain-containing protein [Treponema sp.]|nr:TM2 domain-containing protein [Treponema sp.]